MRHVSIFSSAMPKLRNANSPSLSPLKQGTWKQYDSSRGNPKQWPPDVNMLLSTSRWLEVCFELFSKTCDF